MIRSALLTSALIAAAGIAVARDVTVRSGEHDGYTRLVVQVPPGTEWGLKQSKNGAKLSVTLDDVAFQTGSVFQRLTQNRLATISQPEPGAPLEMEFGCDCAASAFLFRDTMIVVDIAPGSFLPPLTSDIPPPAVPNTQPETKPMTTVQSFEGLTLPLLSLNASGLEDQLAARLMQGADRDIIDLNIAPIGHRTSAANQNMLLTSDLERNIEVTSILDELNGLLGPDVPHLVRRPPCISNAELKFDDWSDDRPFQVQTAAYRSGLYQEFDVIDTARALNLAKLYAYSGFGVEALRALELLGEKTAETDRIAAIARVLDKDPLTDHNPFADLQRCDSDVALWASLTEGYLRDDANLIAIEQAFARLPDHLRRHVGPGLSDLFVKAQKLEAARRVLRSVDRVKTQTSPDVTQSKAKVAKAEGNDPRAEALLTEVLSASEATLEAPLALARLVDKRWTDRGAVSAQEIDLAESYTVEFRRSDIGPVMRRTHTLALSLGQEFDAAMDLATGLPMEAENAEALNRVVLILTERADDETFLRRVLILPPRSSQALTTDSAIAVADRLSSLGFSKQTLSLAKRPQDRLRRGERARLRAKAALLDQRPHQAMLELEDDLSATAASMRVEALMATREFSAAGELLHNLGQLDAANRLFWLADQPDQGDALDDLKYGRVMQATQGLMALPSRQPEKPLADATQLLQDSAETRQRIADLFATLGQE